MARIEFSVSVTDKVTREGVRGIKNPSPFKLESDLKGEYTLEQLLSFTKAALIAVAKEALKEEQAKGFDQRPLVIVDGSKNKPLEFVRPLGKIEFIDSTISSTDVILDIALKIEELSRIVTGTYLKGNFVFFNGSLIATTLEELIQWTKREPKIGTGDIIRFVNVVPYARKLERTGVTSKGEKVRFVKSKDKIKRSGNYILASNGVYYLASRVAIKRYKYNVSVSFRYEFGTTLGIQQYDITHPRTGKKMRRDFATPRGAKKTKRNSGPYLYPTIKLVFGERGTT